MSDFIIEQMPVGVIGLGSLGSKLMTQIAASGQKVVGFDRGLSSPGVDWGETWRPMLIQTVDRRKVKFGESKQVRFDSGGMSAILERCGIVHFALPSLSLPQLPEVPAGRLVVLHDSVMSTSRAELAVRKASGFNDFGSFVIAHCKMNVHGRVAVSTEFGDHTVATQHFESIGLSPKDCIVTDEDRRMARTQGLLALMIRSGIAGELNELFESGDLTPSAERLRVPVNDQEAIWTDPTVDSIMGNPQMQLMLEEWQGMLLNQSW